MIPITDEEIEKIKSTAPSLVVPIPKEYTLAALLLTARKLRDMAEKNPVKSTHLKSGYNVMFTHDQIEDESIKMDHLSIFHPEADKYDHTEADIIAEKILGPPPYDERGIRFSKDARYHYLKKRN